MQNKKELFEAKTRELIEQINQIRANYNFNAPYDITETIKDTRAALLNRDARKKVIQSDIQEKVNFEDGFYAAGFCNITSYIIAHAFNIPGQPPVWRAQQFKNVQTFGSHVWLEFIPTGEIVDITSDQYTTYDGTRMKIPYHLGKPANIDFQMPKAYQFAEAINSKIANAVRKNTSSMPPQMQIFGNIAQQKDTDR